MLFLFIFLSFLFFVRLSLFSCAMCIIGVDNLDWQLYIGGGPNWIKKSWGPLLWIHCQPRLYKKNIIFIYFSYFSINEFVKIKPTAPSQFIFSINPNWITNTIIYVDSLNSIKLHQILKLLNNYIKIHKISQEKEY